MADISIAKEQDANFDAGATFCGIFERLARCTAYERAALFYALECRWCWECGVEQMNEIAHAGCSVERIVASLRAENERMRDAIREYIEAEKQLVSARSVAAEMEAERRVQAAWVVLRALPQTVTTNSNSADSQGTDE